MSAPRVDPSAPSLTEQQRQAALARGVSVVLSSGAGCGKTLVLTERYLSHLRDDGAEVGQVVAITFTDRAARQMRARIRKALSEHLRAAAGEDEAAAWARHLRALETAPISTIHSFCGALLRQHAVEAGLDPRFEVLEDVLSVNLEAEALSACLQRLLTTPTGAGEDLRRLVLLYGWHAVVEAAGRLLHSWDEARWGEWLALPPEQVAAGWQDYARTVLLPRYVEYLLAARPALARCLALLRRHPPLPGKMAENVAFILAELPRLAEAPDLTAAVESLVEAAKVGKIGAKAWPDPAVYEPIKQAFEDFRKELREQQLECFTAAPQGLEEAVAVGRCFLRLVGEVVKTYRERKRSHAVVDFQDLLLLTRDLLRDNAEARARLQERYRFLLIDELQDTDPVQMELVELLCGAGLTAGKLFAVGDSSQSIYRFRGADVYLFQGLRRRMPHEGQQGLTVNFRSQPAILDFTNALLGTRLADYEPLRAYHPQVNPGPCVEFLWSPRPDKVAVAQARGLEAEWIARRIAGMVGREALVADREGGGQQLRPVRPGDVVLLFRAMSNVHLYEAALRRHGLNYYLVGGRAFFAQQEIYDLLNLLRALENPQDAVSLAGTLRSPFCCVSDEALFILGRHREGLWAGLQDPETEARLPADQREPVRRARRHLRRWRDLKDRLPIARLLGQVFADSGYDAATQFEFLGDRKLANLWKLLDLARTFDRSGLFGLAEFIDRLGDLVRTQPREEQAATQPENADVVRLMSIHQAKGLEFPVVIVPDLAASGGGSARPVAEWDAGLGCLARPPADEDPPPFPDFAWKLWTARTNLEEHHEDLRTLYVACTRARDYLVLSAALPESFAPTNAWTLVLAERFDLSTGRCVAPDVPEGRRPLVRVHDRDRPPPTVPREPEPITSCRQDSNPAGAVTGRIGILPPREQPRGRRLVSVGEIEEWLNREETLFEAVPSGNDEVVAAGEETDGWDGLWQNGGCSQAERVLREVLRRWDFGRPDGWRPLLQRLSPPAEDAGARGLWTESERMLERFAAGSLRRRLAEAGTCRREVEYLFRPASGDESLPVVRGVVDCLWQDAEGCWHLLFYNFDEVRAADRERHWCRRQAGLVLAAAAVREQTGAWPSRVALCFLADGGLVERAGSRLGQRLVLPAVVRGLRALSGQPTPG